MPRIMTVDDSLLVRSIITAALNERGFDMVEASDGVEGLEKLDSEEIDLVLLDVMMPGMDDLPCCRGCEPRTTRRPSFC